MLYALCVHKITGHPLKEKSFGLDKAKDSERRETV